MKPAILFFFLIPFFGICQNWKQQVVETSPKLIAEARGFSKIELIKLANKSNPASTDNKDQIILINEKASYAQRFNAKNESIQILKKVNGSEQIINLENSTYAYPINNDGFIMINNFSHGSGSRFDFYSPDFKSLNTYSPFNAGYSTFKFGSLDNLVCLYSKENLDSESFKLALLNQYGSVIVEKEFVSEKHVAFHVKVTKKMIFVFIHVYNSSLNNYTSRVLAFDFSLTEIWRRDISDRMGFGPISKDDSSQIIINAASNIISLNGFSGAVEWTFSDKSLGESTQLIEIPKIMYVDGGKSIVTILGRYNRSIKLFEQNSLFILNSRNGIVDHQTKLGGSSEELKIIPLEDRFLILKDVQLLEFRKIETRSDH